MRIYCTAFALFLVLANVHLSLSYDWYHLMREKMLEFEEQENFGSQLVLTKLEEAANTILMEAKKRELDHGFHHPASFYPARNFLTAREGIENSTVFKIIRRMPKGSVLHAHDTAIVSLEYKLHNLTYRDDLYVCDDDGTLRLKFFKQPNNECNWELLQDVRQDPKRATSINDRIRNEMTMVVNNPAAVYTNVDKCWEKFNSIFALITPLVTYRPVYEDHLYQGLKEMYDDNVMYAELRSTLPGLYELDGTVHSPKEIVGIYKNVVERFKHDHPDFIGVKLIYAPVRIVNRTVARQYVATMKELKKVYPNFIAGFDLVGQEDKGKTLEHFADVLLSVDPTTNFFFHAGETNWLGMSTDENLFDAVLLNTKRIGHGYALTYHPFILEIIKRFDIAIEVNPISNQVLGLVGDLRNHAARRLFAEEFPLVISNDDPGLWGVKGLSYDFYEAFMALMSGHSDLRALKHLALNSIRYSSLSRAEKGRFQSRWQQKWDVFINELINKNFID